MYIYISLLKFLINISRMYNVAGTILFYVYAGFNDNKIRSFLSSYI